MDNTIVQLAIILSISSVLSLFVFRLRLPLVVAYMLAGVALSFLSVFDVTQSLVLHILPEIGIAFVLFLIGMELDLREIKTLGIPIIVAALGQVIITTIGGFAIAGLLGFNTMESIYLGLGLAFSSTVVVVKMLLEKQDLTSLYGKLSIGILLVEDLVAIGVLMFISVSNSALNLGFQQSLPLLTLILKAIGLFILTFVLSRYALERLFDVVAKSTELLFFTAITWCFAFTALAVLSGFSVEIGAFLAGVALASSPYHLQIQGKIKPLRDFFLTLFFIYLGSQVKIEYIMASLPAIIIFTLCALLLKPLIYMLILGIFGFRKHTLFQTALNLSQISEFSLIVLVVGVNAGLVTQLPLSIMASVAVLSIISSSILISLSKRIYKIFAPIMPFFEHKGKVHFLEANIDNQLDEHIIIVGAHRVGGPVVEYLKKAEIPFLVMDFNPYIVRGLREQGLNAVYGDVGDPDVLDSLQIEKAKLIISTASFMGDNEMLLEECRRRKTEATIVVRAEDKSHGEALKALGADYVISPERVSGVYLVNQIKNHWPKAYFPGLD
ncbi:MAG: cation:proton antiporter [Candidatus Daviesbacteria bacterium]|nr:cation:proton antiporter [Candidatus Daviesbacteria bacterium]